MPINLLKNLHETYRMDESLCLEALLHEARLPSSSIAHIQSTARTLVERVRKNRLNKGGLDAFLYQYDLSSDEGIALMCLAEALLRIPDADTVDRLIKDKITSQDWEQHLGKSSSWFVNAATWGLMLTGKMLGDEKTSSQNLLEALKRLASRSSEPIIRNAVRQAMKILGRQFVMAEDIEPALIRARKQETRGYRYSYDMLGEAAKTYDDAEMYLASYHRAIEKIGQASRGLGPIQGPGVSVKLSALHPRYEWNRRQQMLDELLPKLKELVLKAKELNIGFCIDAEEADRLELSLLLIEHCLRDLNLGDWQGFGLAVQAYQKRAYRVIDWLAELARHHRCKLMVRLVKGAYWDSEIKWSQEKGFKGYPVFTRKSFTDISYLACAKKLLKLSDLFYPQFATHNAYSVAAVLEMAENLGVKSQFEFQALHGMGETLYDNIVGSDNFNIPCRIYAPVGGHEHLLGYLVRRLLENGANTSFVNRIIDEQTPIEELIQDPIAKTEQLPSKPHPKIPLPQNIYGEERPNSIGLDLSNPADIDPILQDISHLFPTLFEKTVNKISSQDLDAILNSATKAAKEWDRVPPSLRARCLEKMAHLLDKHRSHLMALLIREGGKTVMDANSELREAIDFCWYYRKRLEDDFQIKPLTGPAGEYNQLTLHGRGVFACISPWNFPLAIFLGQVVGALAAGNAVIAKPASQTPLIALKTIELLHQAGFPHKVLHCIIGSGATLGSQLMEDNRVCGVMFTGSTDTARRINQTLAARTGPIVPFIAETGGQNAMIVDSSALPEQVVTDAITSAFNSAGQRCSALRVMFVQHDIADRIIEMLKGAMATLKIGDPFDLATDVGPVIDENAKQALIAHVEELKGISTLIYECELPENLPTLEKGVFFAPRAYEIESLDILKQEVFGPILHVIRFKGSELDKVIDAINGTGYGLTLGIHSRISEVVEYIHQRAHVGNTYVNRNMIGAVVGVQPFGGEGLSGTGPKAGGPHILPRLALERTLSVNITAAGGNVALMSLSE